MKNTVLVILMLLLIVTPSLAQDSSVGGDPTRGEALARRWCAACHLLEGQGKAADSIPTFKSIAHNPKKGPSYLRTFLSSPHPPMPPLQLGHDEIENLIAYFETLKKR